MNVLACVLWAAGFFFIAAGVLGLLRLPDFYTRLHAMGKCDTVGVALVLAGLAVHEGLTRTSLKLLFVGAFLFIAGPLATHALGRAALRGGLQPRMKGRDG